MTAVDPHAPPRPRGVTAHRRAPRVAVLLPMAFSVRNVVHAGVLARLREAGIDAHLLLARLEPGGAGALPAAFADARACEPMLQPARTARARGKAFLDAVLRSAFSREHRIASYDIYRRWSHRHDSARARARDVAVETLGRALASPRAVEALGRRAEWLYRRSHDLAPVRAQLERIAPDAVWSTMCVSLLEYPYILAARDLGIPVVASILSFDNLTSRGLLPLFDHYLVWSESMREQLLRLYPRVDAARVEVTGTPQFDFHTRPEFRWPRADTLAYLGLPVREGSRYLLYAASHVSLAPREPELVEGVVLRMAETTALRRHHLVIRLHPLDDGTRWRTLAAESPHVRVVAASDAGPGSDGWTPGSAADQARLVSTIAHGDACINVASTMSLDAAILDRPVIGIALEGVDARPREILYEEYGAEHYRPLVESGGLRVARTWDEVGELMERAVREPGRDREARRAMVRRECGVVDGGAAARVAASIGAWVASRAARGAPA